MISANSASGIFSQNATGVLIQGDFIGTDPSGTHPMGNYEDVNLNVSPSPTIGGAAAGAGNVISASSIYGVQLNDSTGALIQGNLIGTDVTGTQPLGNGWGGIEVGPNPEFTATDDSILDNVISANGGGIGFTTATNNLIQGNLIGTDITGTQPLGNNGPGIYMSDSGDNTIGGTTSGAGNVISANNADGILTTSEIFGDNLIEGNKIGTDITGTKPLGNAANGIDLFDESGNTVGGTTPARGQRHLGQRPGRDQHRSLPRQQQPGGRELYRHGRRPARTIWATVASGSTCRTPTTRSAARCAGRATSSRTTAQAGVAVVDNFNGLTTGVAILSNSIYANQALGIDLNDDGVTPNHVGGPDLRAELLTRTTPC